MIDSTNPRSMADNIRKLWDKFKSISGDLLPSRSTATTGQILKLTGENKTPSWADEYSYTPPAYSETEVNTGQKWIDGKDIYRKVITGTFPVISGTASQEVGQLDCDNIIAITSLLDRTDNYKYVNFFQSYWISTSGKIYLNNVNVYCSEKPYSIIVDYTKPDPAPETRDDDTPEAPEEVKETKTRKKTTK